MKRLLFATVFFVSSVAFAGKGGFDISGGGHGLATSRGVSSLDLAEAGIANRNFVFAKSNPDFEKRMRNTWADSGVAKLLVKDESKLLRVMSELWLVDKHLAEAVIKTIGLYSWSLTNNQLEMIPVHSVLASTPASNIVQVAARQGRVIFIQRRYWNKMNGWNRVALITHEALYALGRKCSESRERQVVSALFSGDLRKRPVEERWNFLSDCLPNESVLKFSLLEFYMELERQVRNETEIRGMLAILALLEPTSVALPAQLSKADEVPKFELEIFNHFVTRTTYAQLPKEQVEMRIIDGPDDLKWALNTCNRIDKAASHSVEEAYYTLTVAFETESTYSRAPFVSWKLTGHTRPPAFGSCIKPPAP